MVFVVDVRAGPVGAGPRHRALPAQLGKRVVLAVNKAEGMSESPLLAEFHELGIGEPHPVSAAHGQGIRSLLGAALEPLDVPSREEEADDDGGSRPIQLAVAGRPNVGKSTLINTWLGEERLVAFDQPGTTRDAIQVPFERNGQTFELIDTAGCAARARCSRRSRSSRWSRRCRRSRSQRRRAAARRHAGRDRPGRAHRRLHPRAAARWCWRQQVGRGRRATSARAGAPDRAAAGVPEVRRRCTTSRRSSARGSARCGRRSPRPQRRPSPRCRRRC